MVKSKKGRKLLNTRSAPACPKRDQHHLAVILAKAGGLRTVVDGEGGGDFAQFARELAAVASGAQQESGDNKG